MIEPWPGLPYPLGATFDGAGTNFAVFSEVAERVDLCLYDEDGAEHCITLPEQTGHVWHGYLAGVGPGQRYGLRADGPYEPQRGLRCLHSKLLLDPYAKAIEGGVRWSPAVLPYEPGKPEGPPNTADSAGDVPRSVVVNPFFDWANDRPPGTAVSDSVIYELHVKGFTARHPDIPPELRGTYAGLAHPAAVDHLVDLGVTAVELMPVHHFVHDAHLLDRGLRNYWGYNTIGYFAPHDEYAAGNRAGDQVTEFKSMVRTLHEAGLEVILDVVYNHTAEGNHLGPLLSFKGLDNPAYYRLVADDPRFYTDYTGTGNSLNVRHPNVLQLIMDSLRYWVTEMHVDGFRFDLAATLARGLHAVDRLSSFFDLIQQDPIVSRTKLIAEPWDVGEGGYQVGNFPPLWQEWNGKYRDTVRDFWRGVDATVGELANRLTGSSDLYLSDGRRPAASVNLVTAHDGFTLADLVAYNEKHNEANGEGNRDGESHNRSWNCGVEGPTEDPEVVSLRQRQQRNLLVTLLSSQGVPMLVYGDELGRTQGGNNNAYCQDNEVSWVDWEHVDTELSAFTRRLISLRREQPVLRRRNWFAGHPTGHAGAEGEPLPDIAWFAPDGTEMTEEQWESGYAKSLAAFLNGEGIASRDRQGRPIVGDSLVLLSNAHWDTVDFVLPPPRWGQEWRVVITSDPMLDALAPTLGAASALPVPGRTVVVLVRSGA
ncbi:MAG: glycogen debranching protein GlgX [Acidimicrobiia bacterium]|nr:glycogen debranching protein GlgX [Acidimicrobiia bacterium]